MAAVEQQPAVSGPGRQVPPNKETERGETKLTSNGVDHPFDAAPGVKQAKMSGDTGPGPGAAAQPPNGSNSGPHESNGGPGYPGPGPGGYPGPGYYPGYGPPPPKGYPPYSSGQPGPGGPGGPGPGGPTPTLNSLLQDRGQRFPGSYEGGPPPGPGPGGPPGGPPGGYPGWGYQGHPQYRGQVTMGASTRTLTRQDTCFNYCHNIQKF